MRSLATNANVRAVLAVAMSAQGGAPHGELLRPSLAIRAAIRWRAPA